jgi:hypothetical protein
MESSLPEPAIAGLRSKYTETRLGTIAGSKPPGLGTGGVLEGGSSGEVGEGLRPTGLGTGGVLEGGSSGEVGEGLRPTGLGTGGVLEGGSSGEVGEGLRPTGLGTGGVLEGGSPGEVESPPPVGEQLLTIIFGMWRFRTIQLGSVRVVSE